MLRDIISRRLFRTALACAIAAAAGAVLPATSLSFAETHPAATTQQNSPASEQAAGRGIKLCLKDGTFHMVREYKVEGDRVRFYSVERSDWEEIPSDLVDWDATRQAEAAEAKEHAALIDKIHSDEAAHNAVPVDIDASVQLAPGTFLPDGEGLFLLDKLSVTLLKQPDTNITVDKKQLVKQALSPIPIVPSRRTVSILGPKAKLRITNNQPEFYRRRPDGKPPEIYLIRARVHENRREIENIDTLFGMDVQKRHTIPIETWELVKGVYRLTLSQPLPPGEYAFAEVAIPDETSLYVWDFAIDAPSAKK